VKAKSHRHTPDWHTLDPIKWNKVSITFRVKCLHCDAVGWATMIEDDVLKWESEEKGDESE